MFLKQYSLMLSLIISSNLSCRMNQDSKKKIVFIVICVVVILEIVLYQYEVIQTTPVNQVEANINFNKEINITELDIKLRANLKIATDKKVNFFFFLVLSFNLACKNYFLTNNLYNAI